MKKDLNTIRSIDKIIDNYNIDLNELGYHYTPKQTTFKVFNPLKEKMYLVLDNKKHLMTKENDIFTITINEDLEKHIYHYESDNTKFLDPFTFNQTSDRKNSYILDPNKYNNEIIKVEENKEIAIYEISIRDFTSELDLKDKSKFTSFIKEDLKLNYRSIGFDYLKELGISHIQIMPIFDYDLDNSEYNWGYNPLSYTSLYQGYINDLNDPYKQINEFKELVNKCHKNNIKVVLDVVFNHVYNAKNNNLNKYIKDYFYRFKEDGTYANGSWCGNEVASEKRFVREYIIHVIKEYIKLFDIDGLRFDLMGLLDVETLNEIRNNTRLLKEDFLLYGEGWNMGEVLSEDNRASDLNLYKMDDIGSFNQYYRDSITDYILKGDIDNEYFYDLLNGSNNHGFKTNQTINYVECHDGYTFFDQSYGYSDIDRLKKVKLALAIITFSRGLSFYQSGQEFLRSKAGVKNSYNSGDEINKLSWNDSVKYQDNVEYFKSLLRLKNEIGISKRRDEEIYFENYYEVIKYHIGEYTIFINLCNFDHVYEDGKEYEVIFDENGFNLGKKTILNLNSNSTVIVKNI